MSAPNSEIREMLDHMVPRPRLIDIMVADRRDGTFDLIYVVQHEGKLVDVRFVFREEDELESLAPHYSGALCMEKEAMEMFGVKFKGVSGNFLLDETSPKAPLRLKPKEVAKDG
jgi:NADH:ubiquinone oxidoreductase subunit C